MIDGGEDVRIYLCDLCGEPVLRKKMADDYHKGYHTVGSQILKPYEERTINVPECNEDVFICQDCTGKSLEPIIIEARIEQAQEDLKWLQKGIEQDSEKLKKVSAELKYDIKEGKRLVPLMVDHIKQLEQTKTSTFDYQEHDNWEKQRREHNR
jgi:hypothetical protein